MVGEKYWSPLKIWSLFTSFFFFFTDKINLERLNTKIYELLPYFPEDDYVDDFKETIDEILKDNDCEVSSDNDEVAECAEIEKRCQISCISKARIF